MVRADRCLIALLAVLLVAESARATIDFRTGQNFLLGRRPNLFAVGDFDRDTMMDLSVSSQRSHEVTVLIGSDQDRFLRGAVHNVGRRYRDHAAADINPSADTFDDLILLDHRLRDVLVLLGRGNGTFDQPIEVHVTRQSRGLAVADFNGDGFPDIAVTQRPKRGEPGVVQVFLNDGNPRPRFRAGGETQVALLPTEVVAGDFNGDNRIDMAVLNSGGPIVKSISILINIGLDQTGRNPVFRIPITLSAGQKPRQMHVADLNGDTKLDLVWLHQPRTLRNGEVQMLFGRGDGFFDGIVGLPVECPIFSNDLICKSRALTVSDYDLDGNIDLAVAALEIREQVTTRDFMTIFRGRVGGNFSQRFTIDTLHSIKQLGTGDFNGDAFPDIAAISANNNQVQLFVNQSITPRPGGDPCTIDDDCASEHCENGICCERACTGTESCAVCGSEGMCVELLPNGESCVIEILIENIPTPIVCPAACLSGFCVDDFCCNLADCPDTQRCDIFNFEGMCHDLLPPGQPCENDMDCAPIPARCRNGFCPSGEPCTLNGDCQEEFGFCVDGVCCQVGACPPDEVCAPPNGTCQIRTPTPTPRQGPGEDCDSNADCVPPLICENGVCCTADCPSGSFCVPIDFPDATPGTCERGTPPPTKTRTPTRIPSPTPTLEACPDGFERVGDACVKSDRGGGCQTGPSGPGSGSVLVLGLLPLAWWAARRRQTRRAPVCN